ncbi:MAG: acyl-CoA thioesterase [Desulfarculales bacterium]|jgi:acyl-CoA thioester hydrolase|nr:acyl-CoA thioesterase [Desulfarculales bacterium]
MNTHRLEIRPLFADVDAMNIVYNAIYLRYFELGRTELMRSVGVSYASIEEQNLRFPVSEAHVRYRRPARYDELLYLDTWLDWVKRVSLCFAYRLSRPEKGELVELAAGYTTLGCITHQGKVSLLPDNLVQALLPYVVSGSRRLPGRDRPDGI